MIAASRRACRRLAKLAKPDGCSPLAPSCPELPDYLCEGDDGDIAALPYTPVLSWSGWGAWGLVMGNERGPTAAHGESRFSPVRERALPAASLRRCTGERLAGRGCRDEGLARNATATATAADARPLSRTRA